MKLIRQGLRRLGFDVVRWKPGERFPDGVTPEDKAIIQRVRHATMTSTERLLALISSVRHVSRQKITGAIVECGVWRGGSSMAAALTLLQEGDTSRPLYLFDTFEGMPPPTAADKANDGQSAEVLLQLEERNTGIWCYSSLDEVRRNIESVGYPNDKIKLVKGMVETTIPTPEPIGPIAILRLDTDWYESTKHEMLHLFPLLQEGGILIIDDYGHWEGARKAIDEYLGQLPRSFYLHRIDYTGRLLVKR